MGHLTATWCLSNTAAFWCLSPDSLWKRLFDFFVPVIQSPLPCVIVLDGHSPWLAAMFSGQIALDVVNDICQWMEHFLSILFSFFSFIFFFQGFYNFAAISLQLYINDTIDLLFFLRLLFLLCWPNGILCCRLSSHTAIYILKTI